jgi:hypothetical protein
MAMPIASTVQWRTIILFTLGYAANFHPVIETAARAI